MDAEVDEGITGDGDFTVFGVDLGVGVGFIVGGGVVGKSIEVGCCVG